MTLILTLCDFSAKIKIFLLMITLNINKYLRDFLALLSPIANNLAHAKLKSIRLTIVFLYLLLYQYTCPYSAIYAWYVSSRDYDYGYNDTNRTQDSV